MRGTPWEDEKTSPERSCWVMYRGRLYRRRKDGERKRGEAREARRPKAHEYTECRRATAYNRYSAWTEAVSPIMT
jgi:hypothetical protein